MASCQRAAEPSMPAEPAMPPWFADVTQELGLAFVQDPGPPPGPGDNYFMPQIMGSGGAFLDFDNDGRLDIYLVNNAGPQAKSTNRLFHQEADGRFKDVTAGSGLDITGYGMGVAVGDVNNDGYPDVLVTEYGRTRLFLNNGNGAFTDVTKEAGIDNRLWGCSAAFVDFDRDGWLDLVIVNYVDYDPTIVCSNNSGRREYCAPVQFRGTVTRLYRNRGPVLTETNAAPRTWAGFEDVTLKSGLGDKPGPGLGVLCADFDGDGWPDIFVANDAQPNHLWMNQQDGTFREEAVARGVAFNRLSRPEGNMGTAWGDADGDGLFDLFVTHLADETNRLWKQGPRGHFQDISVASGLASPHWRGTGFGTVLADFNNDGFLDVAVVNGSVAQPNRSIAAGTPHFQRYAEHNQLFAGLGRGQFRDVSVHNPPLCGTPAVSRALVCGDVNNDGGIDLLVTAVAGPARLYRNIAPNRGHWLLIRAVDPQRKRDAYGAEITVRSGERRWLSMINPGQSYLGSNDSRAHFGLGAATQVDEIRVRWPDGADEVFPGSNVDKIVTLKKGEGRKP